MLTVASAVSSTAASASTAIAILITVMVLELHIPEGTRWRDLHGEAPVLLTYVLSFAYLAIYWNSTELARGSVAVRMLQTVGIFALGQIGYCSLFGCVGVLTGRTLIRSGLICF